MKFKRLDEKAGDFENLDRFFKLVSKEFKKFYTAEMKEMPLNPEYNRIILDIIPGKFPKPSRIVIDILEDPADIIDFKQYITISLSLPWTLNDTDTASNLKYIKGIITEIDNKLFSCRQKLVKGSSK